MLTATPLPPNHHGNQSAATRQIRRIRYRAGQFFRQIDPRSGLEVDSALAVLLSEQQLALVCRLSPADRRHLLAVHRALVADGWTDPNLLTAALLHDIGKADPNARVNAVHRVLKVLLNAFAPGTLPELAKFQHDWLRHGLYLSLNHAAIGAELARRAGASERSCWLIAHHDDDRISGDPALLALRVRDARE